MWKDYYLDHKDRLDAAILSFTQPPKPIQIQTTKKPSPSSYSVSSPAFPSSAGLSSPAIAIPSRRKSQSAQPARAPPQPSGSRRRTINSLTTHVPVYDDHLPPPNADIKIPPPPSRSPTPPTKVIPHNRGGHKFTPEDRTYFIKFISWRLKCDPSLGRNDLCEQLAEKASNGIRGDRRYGVAHLSLL